MTMAMRCFSQPLATQRARVVAAWPHADECHACAVALPPQGRTRLLEVQAGRPLSYTCHVPRKNGQELPQRKLHQGLTFGRQIQGLAVALVEPPLQI